MKRVLKKTVSLLLVLLLLALGTSALAAEAVLPGGTATVSFAFSDVMGIDGAVSVTGASAHSTSVVTEMTNSGSGDSVHCYASGKDGQSVVVNVQVTASSAAAIGDAITVSFQYRISDAHGNFSGWTSASETVTVSSKASGADPTPTPELTPTPEPTLIPTPEPTAPPAPTPVPTTPAPVVTAPPAPVTESSAIEAGQDVMSTETEPSPTPVRETPEETAPPAVPSEPDSPCTVTLHKVWPILFFISLAVNVGLILFFFVRKKRQETDNTPLVDYDISDDL